MGRPWLVKRSMGVGGLKEKKVGNALCIEKQRRWEIWINWQLMGEWEWMHKGWAEAGMRLGWRCKG